MSAVSVSLTQMLATRLCHDLAGPISATSNGIELLEVESDASMVAQAQDLLKLSAGEAAAKLQMYRVAYGRHEKTSESDVSETRQIVMNYFHYNRIELDWPEGDGAGFPLRINNQIRQIVVNMVLLVASQLVFGGVLSVRKESLGLEISGTHTRLKDDMELEMVLRGRGNNEYTPQNAPAYFVLHYAEDLGLDLAVECSENTFKLSVRHS